VSKMVSYQFERQDNLIYQVCAVRFLDLEPAGSLLFKHVVQNQVQAIVRHLTQHTPFAASFPNRDNELVLVLGLDPLEANEDEGMLLLRRIRESIERNCQYRIDLWYAVGIHSLRDIAKSYEQLNPLDPLETDNRGFSMQDRESLMVQSIKKHVETHYWNEHLTVNDIAEEIRYTTAYVCMIFKKETGITLNQFINMYRIGKAKELLKDVTLKLAEVAEMVGYSNENYFSKVFKKYEGYSPSDLKKGGKRE
jgi:AraC-like DNA-binding protein